MHKMGLKSSVVLDERFAVGQSYGANGTPSALLIDANGKIASKLAIGAPGVLGLLGGHESVHGKPAMAVAANIVS